MAGEDQELLNLLEAHGQQFLASFDYPQSRRKRKEKAEAGPSSLSKRTKTNNEVGTSSSDDDEWFGFDKSDVKTEEESDVQQTDDDAPPTSVKRPSVVHFADPTTGAGSSNISSSAHQKAFMSSKVAKLTQALRDEPGSGESESEGEENDLTNAQNDALLHRLVHTKILSGSLNPDLNLTPAQRRKALAGRVLEAAGQVKLGKGEAAVRAKERNRAAKHVREGLIAKQKERHQKEVQEAKHMGNYHPVLKRLYDDETDTRVRPKRERGLKMGVGSFSGGVLKLNKSDIASVAGQRRGASRGRGRGGGRGGGGGGGRGRGTNQGRHR